MRAKINYDAGETIITPGSRVYLCPKTDQIIHCAMGLGHPIDVDALKQAFSTSIMIKHPRFCSLLIKNHAKEHYKKTDVNIDDHFIIHTDHPTFTATTNPPKSCHTEDDVEVALNAYLADLALSTPLSENKPLWEVHVLMGLNCIVLRMHHALGDGDSLMSMLSACFGEKRVGAEMEDEEKGVLIMEDQENGGKIKKTKGKRKWREEGVRGLIKTVWFTLVFALKCLGRLLWVKDETSMISGGDGVQLLPRKLETVKFQLQDFKSIKEAISNAELPDLMRTNSWGNKTGMVLQPIHCCTGLHPLEHVKRMKAIMDQKKQSFEAHVPYICVRLISSFLGPKAASWCSLRMLHNTTLLISNIKGPSEEMTSAGNPITYMRVNVGSLPQALTLHMVSYAGRADLQVMVAEHIISDPQFLAKCFQESLLAMKSQIACCNK